MSQRFLLGRADARNADILLQGGTISAKHAEISIDTYGALFIRDLGSSNGTSIIRGGGKALAVSSQNIALRSSDRVSLGGNEFTVDTLLSKMKVGSVSSKYGSLSSSKKMMRCTHCGSITPQGSVCIECHHG